MQMEDMSIEWSLPVASTVLPHQVFSAGTKADPGILFASAPSDLGIADSNFSDSYAYLTRVDNRGHIVFRKLIGVSRENCALWHCQPDSNFYLIHTRPLVDAKTVEDTVGSSNYLTRLNSLGDVLAQVQEPEPAADVWTADFTGDNRPEVYTLSRKGVVRVYDTSLSLLAQSGGSNLTNMTGILPTFGTERNVLVLSNPRGSAVYDRLMRPLAELPFYSQYVEGLEYNSAGDMLALVSSFRERGAIERVQRRGLLDYARIAYLDYQNYVLAVLSSLLIGLLVTNYYRRRVTSQKQHLEEANDELARTHQALQKAQATIVQQEKYKQAKDIAGGFAHEIRNALFPADSSVTKLNELTEKGPLEKETVIRFLTSAGASISRAINITELISRYTKLDSQYLPEKVDLAEAVSDVLNANQLRIAESGVAVVTTEKAGFFIEANRTQFHMVINNLVLNSLDALTNRTNPTIIIKWVIEKEFAHVSISDNGCGIPAENVPKVFDTFYSTKPNRGTGLGLAIAKRIIDMYGGSISVWSEPDKGTRFDVMMKAYGSE
jgi:signal transduction histidine kinase